MQHHTKYLEIHGEESLITMGKGKHLNFHKRLRKEGKCTVPKEILNKLSHRSYDRRALCRILFSDSIEPFVELQEVIIYNQFTGNITISTGFYGTNGHSLGLIR